ncbi:MAG TPA: hypothetical protein VNM15_07335 [Candidatus Binatia bacterium]|nr:hypothetical protein [Candidatus Binatia bacterium]
MIRRTDSISDKPQALTDSAGPGSKFPSPLVDGLRKASDSDYLSGDLGPFTRQLLKERMDALTREVATREPTDPLRRAMIGELLRLMNLANTLRKNR